MNSYFQIKATIPSGLSDSLWLILQYGAGINGYLVYNPKDCTIVKSTIWENENNELDPDIIFASIQRDIASEISFSKTILINYNPVHIDIPGVLYQPDKINRWIELSGEHHLNEKIITKERKDTGVIHIHSINNKFYELLLKRYKEIDIYSFYEFAHYEHLGTLGVSMILTFFHQHIYVSLYQNDDLQINQAYTFSTPEDVLYHLMNIVEQFSLDKSTLTLIPEGFLYADTSMYHLLDAYFPNIQKPENIKCNYHKQTEALSPYILRHIDRLILCVS